MDLNPMNFGRNSNRKPTIVSRRATETEIRTTTFDDLEAYRKTRAKPQKMKSMDIIQNMLLRFYSFPVLSLWCVSGMVDFCEREEE
ncbi:hypothetical protein A4A49_34715 [Nicotiana attenuata]|uniref:Uncharacterized protein n=1 Tax=Nicotiana attenuata TaxID=49451 RepID=A0A1J6K9G4_NICAT|nr:hypothetical protein A4A49_34715 [Nicotiana attenuata]